MRLLTGPAGSGKTTYILERFREGLRVRDEGVCLLVPTATLAQHLQNRVAREGFVFRRGLIQTFSGFVDQFCVDVPQVPDTVFYLIAEEVVQRIHRPEFARVAQLAGFCASVARTIGEFSSAGCDAARLEREAPTAPLAPGFLAIYREVERELERRGMALRAKRLEHAARRIEQTGATGIHTILFDGFHALPDPELEVIRALSRHTQMAITLTDTDLIGTARARLLAMGFEEARTVKSRPSPAAALVKSPGLDREVEEIARRILEQAASGRPFREIGIIVRPAENYVPLLRSTLERFGIPARFYFDSDLEQHAVIRYLSGAIDAMLGGWDHVKTLAVLRLAPRFADSNALDRLDFSAREQIPNQGLGPLRSMLLNEDGRPNSAGAERLLHKIDSLAALEEWRGFSMTPKDWAARFQTLRNLFRPSVTETGDRSLVLQWKSQAAVLDAFDEAVGEAASALDSVHPVTIEPFWAAVKRVLRLKPLRLADGRRNVVHVLGAHEARQWVLPVIYICGMVEKQFPQFHRQNLFFPDAALQQLNAAGVRLRTADELEREERALFHSAISRATVAVTLSYPEFDARGDRNLPSLFLEDLLLSPVDGRPVRPQPRHTPSPAGPFQIQNADLLAYLHARTARLSPTGLEMYLQCAFQYFGGRTLRLKAPPGRPEDRLDFLTQGNIVHSVLARWYAAPCDIEQLFEEEFARELEAKNIQPGYHTERLRNAMVEDLHAFATDGRWPLKGLESRMEEPFEFDLTDSIRIAGKIDRLDFAADGSVFVTDYKYSRAQTAKGRRDDENLLQAPLYAMAAERVFGVRAAGMHYVALKGGIEEIGWDAPFPEGFFERAIEKTVSAVEEIRAGRVAVEPSNRDKCRYCDFRDVCRVAAAGEAAEVAEGA
jgi:ATP-dependent helicase/DNAse subunit B